jgi:hypothetical protein
LISNCLQTLDVMRRSMAYSRIMDTKGEKMITQDFTPQAKLSQHLKDVRLMLSASSIPLPLSETHRQLLEKAESLGFGDADNSAVIKAIRRSGNVFISVMSASQRYLVWCSSPASSPSSSMAWNSASCRWHRFRCRKACSVLRSHRNSAASGLRVSRQR